MIRLDKEQLQHMYPEMEEAFENRMHSMIHALPSQKEEKTMKKLTLRTALIAALIIAAMMAVALAATSGGLVEWFQSNYGATLPKTAQEILSTTQKSVMDEIFEINFEWNVLDEQGEPYPIGVSLSGEFLDGDGQTIAWEEMQSRKLESMQYMLMISADELPESLVVTDYTVKIPVK